MKDFWRLTYFEYKKIFKRKSAVIGIIFVYVFSVITCILPIVGNHYVEGSAAESKYEAIKTDKAYAMAITGREVDTELILEMSEAYSHIPEGVENYSATKEYNTYARPYSEIYRIVKPAYYTGQSSFSVETASNMTKEQAESFYDARRDAMISDMKSTGAGQEEIDFMLEKDSQVSKPVLFSYSDGYSSLASFLYTAAVFLVFVISICLAPLFSGEYTSRTDQLLLTSKYGKSRLIAAKLFTGISFSVIFAVTVILIQAVIAFAIYGTEGFNAALQLIDILCCYDFTLGQAIIIFMVILVIACVYTASISMAMSAAMKSPFPVMIIMSLMNFVPMIINLKGNAPYLRVLHKILVLFPIRMCNIWDPFSSFMYNVFGNFIEPYIFMPVFALIFSVLMLSIAYRKFKTRQIR